MTRGDVQRVLLVEDNPGDVMLLREALGGVSSTEVCLTEVARLSDALAYLTNDRFTLVLLDLALPDSHGLASVTSVRAAAPDIPIVVLTGLGDEDAALAALQAGAQDYLLKGEVDGRLLVRAMRYAVERKRAQQALASSEARFRALVQRASDLIIVLTEAGRFEFASPSITSVLGYDPDQLVGTPALDIVHTEDGVRVTEALDALRAGQSHARFEVRVRHCDGSWRSVESVASNLLLEPSVGGIVINARDVTDRVHAEAATQANEARWRALVQHSSDMISILDADGIIRYVSPGVEQVLGFVPEELEGTSVYALVHPDDRAPAETVYEERLAAPGAARTATVRLRHLDGRYRVVESVGTNLLGVPGIDGIIYNTRDVTTRRNLEAQLRHQARTDALTGLPNRRQFVDRLERALAARDGTSVGVLYLDLDGFKRVNDSFGHAAGDALLMEVAARLKSALRPGDLVARQGGDEFTVLVDGLSGVADALQVANRILAALRRPVMLGQHEAGIGTSIGLTVCGARAVSALDLLREADTALYQAKAAGKGCTAIFDAAMDARTQERMTLERDLRHALDRAELELVYQPDVELATGVIRAVEALLRWRHPVRGLLTPDVFLPVAEQAGLLPAVGDWVLTRACHQARAWQDLAAAGEPPVVSIKLLARQFWDEGFAGRVAATLEESGLTPALLCMEVAESIIMHDPETAVARCHTLAALGVRLSIDRFGAGYSSLTYLRRLPLDTLKLDPSVVTTLEWDRDTVAVVRAVAMLAADLGLTVTVGGLETRAQLSSALVLECHRGQGAIFAAPAPAGDITALLAAGGSGKLGVGTVVR
jgi:diguanylate cyclase (GGDEF)-like protein/PAS domain S-box-containing protein